MKQRFFESSLKWLLILSLFSLAMAVPENPFLVQTKLFINNRPQPAFNTSLSLNKTSTLSFKVPSQAYKQSCVLSIKLYAWYNAEWTSRTSLNLKLNAQKFMPSERDHLLLHLMKYTPQIQAETLAAGRKKVMLTNATVLVSYDPQSSYLVSRLEDPELFNPNSNYQPISELPQKRGDNAMVTVTLKSLIRTDSLIDDKNGIVALRDLGSKLQNNLPSLYVPTSEVSPNELLKHAKRSISKLKDSGKIVTQKMKLIDKSGMGNLVLPWQPYQIDFKQQTPLLYRSMLNKSITLTDSVIPFVDFTFHQAYLFDHIESIGEALRSHIASPNTSYGITGLLYFTEWSNWITFFCALLWVDGFGGATSGTSAIHGRMLNILLWCGIVRLVFRVSFDSHIVIGVTLFVLCMILHWWMGNKVVNRWNSQSRPYSNFDKAISTILINSLVSVVIVNGVWHWQAGNMGDIQLLFWLFSQWTMLVWQYFFFICGFAQVLMNFRCGNASGISITRILYLTIIVNFRIRWIVLDISSWPLVFLGVKQCAVVFLLVLQKILMGAFSPTKPKEQSNKVEQQQKEKLKAH